jgi:uncharacterized protein (TIGR02266 family)
VDDDFRLTRLEDISWGGVFAVLEPPAILGSRVAIQFTLAEDNVSLELQGTVVRNRKPAVGQPGGIGIQFDNLDDDSRSLIQQIINEEIRGLLQSV